jgi:hypothetical protein
MLANFPYLNTELVKFLHRHITIILKKNVKKTKYKLREWTELGLLAGFMNTVLMFQVSINNGLALEEHSEIQLHKKKSAA